jgi:hypothetical protein
MMHIEKNVCESLVGTLLNTNGKTRDHGHARANMKKMRIRQELWLDDFIKEMELPTSCITLSKNEKEFCGFSILSRISVFQHDERRSFVRRVSYIMKWATCIYAHLWLRCNAWCNVRDAHSMHLLSSLVCVSALMFWRSGILPTVGWSMWKLEISLWKSFN